VRECVLKKNYVDGTKCIRDFLPPPQDTRSFLDKCFKTCSDRSFRVILVEDFGDYKVFIQTPGVKSECDFFVWRAVFKGKELVELKVPSHDDLGGMFSSLRKVSPTVESRLLDAVVGMLRDRMGVAQLIEKYFKDETAEVKRKIGIFLATLKWIGLQEDANYPPPRYLGSKFTLAVYALLEVGFSPSDLRRVLRFKL